MSEVRHFRRPDMPMKTARLPDGSQTAIARVVNADFSRSLGAGVERLEATGFEWTVTYDEVLFIREGAMTLRVEGRDIVCVPGDIVWLPEGTTLAYDCPGVCEYFYALYPVDWAKRQGTEEP